LCHAAAPPSPPEGSSQDGHWTCATCSQQCSAGQLATAAAYAVDAAAHPVPAHRFVDGIPKSIR
jgi:hypothetical protein